MKTPKEILEQSGEFNQLKNHGSETDWIIQAMEKYAEQFKHPDNEADGIVFCGKCGKQK